MAIIWIQPADGTKVDVLGWGEPVDGTRMEFNGWIIDADFYTK
jgi:hypothetical protein